MNSLILNYTTTEVISQSLVVEILQLIRTNGEWISPWVPLLGCGLVVSWNRFQCGADCAPQDRVFKPRLTHRWLIEREIAGKSRNWLKIICFRRQIQGWGQVIESLDLARIGWLYLPATNRHGNATRRAECSDKSRVSSYLEKSIF